ncbi:MAG TPA: SpoIIE family protein phosphatase, partial [Vicinamibacteria bacterium]|nr:SpoIIE family protein phosphatase [Vicinamibacteria bacterium]
MSLVPRRSAPVREGAGTTEPRPRAALVCGPRGLPGQKALAAAFDLSCFAPRDAPRRLRDGRADVVILDGGLPAEIVTALLEPLAMMAEEERPAVVLVARHARAAGIPPERQSVVDEFVSAGQGSAVLVERVRAALRVRGWMNELSRKNAELQGLYQRLEVLADRMAEELRLASNVQRSLLPPPVQHARLEVAREFLPFREIGGDYYDFMPIAPHKLVFAIGDVMGKGVPAALLAANLKASIRAQVEGGDLCPEALVAKVNRMFWDVVPTGLFSTLFYAVFDLEAGTLAYVNAGHHHPFVVRADGTIEDLV